MKGSKAIVGIFTYVDDAINAINSAKKANLEYKVYSPTYVPELAEVADNKRSYVAILTFIGGITGITFGFGLAILCGLDWPLRVSAKDIVSVPAYIVVGYECTILFGALATLLAVFHFCRLPDIFRKPGYDPRFSHDKFGVVVGCDSKSVDDVKAALTDAGADEVKVEDGL